MKLDFPNVAWIIVAIIELLVIFLSQPEYRVLILVTTIPLIITAYFLIKWVHSR